MSRSSTCQNCGAGLEQPKGRGRPRKFCSICRPPYGTRLDRRIPLRDVECRLCGKVTKGPGQKRYCSKRCRWAAAETLRRKPVEHRICSWCLGSFESSNWQKRYCSQECCQTATKARARFNDPVPHRPPLTSHQYKLRRTGAQLCKCGCGMYTRAQSGYFVGGWTVGGGRRQGASHRPPKVKPIQPSALPCLGGCGHRTWHESGLCRDCGGRSRQHARSNAIRQLLDELGMSRELLATLTASDRAEVMKNVEAALGLR